MNFFYVSGNFCLVVEGIAAATVDTWKNRSCSLHISSEVPGDTSLLSYFHVSEGSDLGIPALTSETGTAVKMFSVGHTCSSCCF